MMVLNWPPDECPKSGANWFCRTENSATASFGIVTNGPVTALSLLSTPSMVKLLFLGRWPPMLGPVPAPIPPPVATPALKSERFRTPPVTDDTGRSAASFWSKVLAIWAVDVSKAGAAPETSMDMAVPLISRVICSELVLFNSSWKLLIVVVAKWEEDPETRYVPTGRLLKRYSPFSFAWVPYLTPVSELTASTVAPGTAAPVLSRTVPTRPALITWALTATTIVRLRAKMAIHENTQNLRFTEASINFSTNNPRKKTKIHAPVIRILEQVEFPTCETKGKLTFQ